jgi:hypothetical protein
MKIIGLALAALLASAAIINAQTARVEIARILRRKTVLLRRCVCW